MLRIFPTHCLNCFNNLLRTEAAIQSGLYPYKMMPLEMRELPEFIGDEQSARYFDIRNHILKCWHSQPTVQLTKAYVIERIQAKYRKMIDRVFDFLERYLFNHYYYLLAKITRTSEKEILLPRIQY